MNIRVVQIELNTDTRNDGVLGAVPSSYILGHMYENNCTELQLIVPDYIDLASNSIKLVFSSGYVELGSVTLGDDLRYSISEYYTQSSLLSIQVMVTDKDTGVIRSRTNIINFKLGASIKPTSEFSQNLSYLNRAVLSGNLVLSIDNDMMIFSDNLGNELFRYDIYSVLHEQSSMRSLDGRGVTTQ